MNTTERLAVLTQELTSLLVAFMDETAGLHKRIGAIEDYLTKPHLESEPDEILDLTGAAAILGINYSALLKMITDGYKLPHKKLGKTYVFVKSEVLEYVKEHPLPPKTRKKRTKKEA